MICTIIKNKILNPNVNSVVIADTADKLEMGVLSIDGRATTLVNEQIASFTELAAKHGDIDQKCAKKIRKKFYHVLTALQSREPPSFEQLRELYHMLYSQIEKTILQAQLSGKNALIVGLEDHDDRKSLFVEFMIIDIANRLGIKNLMIEADPDLLEELKTDSLDSITSPNIPFILKLAKEYEFKILPCDPHPLKCEEVRIIGINQSILKSNENSVFFIGVNHLKHISLDKDISQMYEVLNLNASNIGEAKRNHLFKNQNYRRDELNFAFNPDHALQANVPGNPYSIDVAEMRSIIDSVKGTGIIMGLHLYVDGMWNETRFSSPDALPATEVESEVESAKDKEKELKVLMKRAELAAGSWGKPQQRGIQIRNLEPGHMIKGLTTGGKLISSSLGTTIPIQDIDEMKRAELAAGSWGNPQQRGISDFESELKKANNLWNGEFRGGALNSQFYRGMDTRRASFSPSRGLTAPFQAIGPNSNLNLPEDEDFEPSEESTSFIPEECDIAEMGAGDQNTPVGFKSFLDTVD